MDSRILEEYGFKGFVLPFGKLPPPKGWQRLAGRQAIPEGKPYGISTENFAVVDIDRRSLIERFEEKYRDLLTTVVGTPRGGRHYYFSGKTRNQQNDGWDVRGVGGYVVGAGSRFSEKVYTLLSELLPVDQLKPFPAELKKKAVRRDIPSARNGRRELDLFTRLSRVRLWLVKREPAEQSLQGSGGRDDRMFYACCRMFQDPFLLTIDQAIGPILEYNARCIPPFTLREIEHKLEDAFAAETQKR